MDVDQDNDIEGDDWPRFHVTTEYTSGFRLGFDVSENRELHERVCSLSVEDRFDRSNWSDGDGYAGFVDLVVDFACEAAAAYDAEYVTLASMDRHSEVSPSGTPFADHIEQAPHLAVYEESLLADLGGLETLYGGEPWRYAHLDSGHVLAMTADGPWQGTEFTESQRRDLQAGEAPSTVDLRDPFRELEPGEYGTDVVLEKSDIAPKFTNDILALERCYRDESDALRRVEDDSFVRRIAGDDGSSGEIPDGVDPNDERVSALLHESIPPEFVRLDDPDGETIVSKVLSLDVDTNKFDLLVRLGKIAEAEDFDDEVLATIDGIVSRLGELDDEDGIDAYIQQNIF